MKTFKKNNEDIENRLLDFDELRQAFNVKIIEHKRGKYLDFSTVLFDNEEHLLNMVAYIEQKIPLITIASLELKELFAVSLLKHLSLNSFDIFINNKKDGIKILINFIDNLFIPRSELKMPKGVLINDKKTYDISRSHGKLILSSREKHDLIFIKWVENEVFDNPDNESYEIDKYISNPHNYNLRIQSLLNR